MKKYVLFGLLVAVLMANGIAVWQSIYFEKIVRGIVLTPTRQLASVAAVIGSQFYYTFNTDGILDEIGKIDNSSSSYFWLSSGGQLILKDGTGRTIHGELGPLNKWRLAYAVSNPVDTNDGYHPQNIFRLVTRSKWQNFSQEISFNIVKSNISASRNRNASNGVFFFSRYQDSQNVYYSGIRVDGEAVIKKKVGGSYHTLVSQPFYVSDAPYNRDTNSNLIPSQKWIGLRSEIRTNADNTVSIKLFVDKDKTGNWVLAAEVMDNGSSGGLPFLSEGYAGIRADFMDMEFDNYKIIKQ